MTSRRLNSDTVSMTLEVPAGPDNTVTHALDVSLVYFRGALHEIAFVGRGKIGQGMDLLLQDLGLKLSRAIQGRDPDTGDVL